VHRLGSKSNTYINIPRLTSLPSASNPLFVFLGVRKDHRTAVLLVSSIAQPSGQGECRPSSQLCQILDLKVGQNETFTVPGATGATTVQYNLYISAIRFEAIANPTAAHIAHRRLSRTGQQIVDTATPFSIGLQGLAYSPAAGGFVYSHPVSPAWLELMQYAGGAPARVLLKPATTPDAALGNAP
jgi:hypothetical protein